MQFLNKLLNTHTPHFTFSTHMHSCIHCFKAKQLFKKENESV